MSWETIEKLKQNENYPELIEDLYKRRLRASKIIYNLSEFLKFLSIDEGDILKSMLVKFACEAVDSTRGSLLLRDSIHNEFYYYDTVLFKDEKQVLENFNDTLSTITFKDNHGHIGDTYRTKNVIIIENIGKYKRYDKKVDELLGIDPLSVICVPIIVDNEFIGVLELVNSKEKRSFDEMDLEFINTIANIASATMENAKLFKWAISDGLTQIYNIHFFRRMLEQEIKKIDRYGGVLSIIMMDVDDFKTVNDTYGHQIGDKVLQMLSSIIKKNIREEIDLPGRYGGDEFIVLLPNTNLKGAEILANRLLEKIRSSKIKANGSTINFTSSLGCAEFKKGRAMEDLIEAADKAMYLSKNKGKNSVCSVENY